MNIPAQDQQPKLPAPPKGLPLPSSKTPGGRERLHQIVTVAIEVATGHGHLDQVRAIQQLYEQSKTDRYVAELMDVVLARKATLEQYTLFRAYMKNLREDIPTPRISEIFFKQDQESSELTGEGSSFTAIGSRGGAESVANSIKESHSGDFRGQLTEGGSDSGLGLVLSGKGNKSNMKSLAHQHIVEPKLEFKTALPQSKGNMKAIQSDKRGSISLKQDGSKVESASVKLRRRTHPDPEYRRDTEYLTLHSQKTRGGRSSKRLKMMREERTISVAQQSSGEEEKVMSEEESISTGLVPENKSVVVEPLCDRDFLFKVIDGCMVRSAQAGFPEIGYAIKDFYEESLVNPELEGFFESLITGRVGSESVLHFQKFVREYVLDSQERNSRGAKPVSDDTVPVLHGNELGFTANQYGDREGRIEATTFRSDQGVEPRSPKRNVDNKGTTNNQASTINHSKSILSATTLGLGSILTSHATFPLPNMLSPHMTRISEIPDSSDSPPSSASSQSV